MNSFVFWLDRPFHPGRVSKPARRGTRLVTIRYKGSLARSALKTLIVLVLLAVMANVIGDRTSPASGASEVAAASAAAGIPR